MNITDFVEKTIKNQDKELNTKELKRLKKYYREKFIYLVSNHSDFLKKAIYRNLKRRIESGKRLTEKQIEVLQKLVDQWNNPSIKKFCYVLGKYRFLQTHIKIYKALEGGNIFEKEHWYQIKAVLHGYKNNPEIFNYFDKNITDPETNLLIYDTLVEHKLLDIDFSKIADKDIREKVIKENNRLGAFYDSKHRGKSSTYHYIKKLMKKEHPLTRDNYRFVNSYLKIVKYDENTVSIKAKTTRSKTRSVKNI